MVSVIAVCNSGPSEVQYNLVLPPRAVDAVGEVAVCCILPKAVPQADDNKTFEKAAVRRVISECARGIVDFEPVIIFRRGITGYHGGCAP